MRKGGCLEWSIVLHILLHNHPQETLKNAM
jgi:hypothetical protein